MTELRLIHLPPERLRRYVQIAYPIAKRVLEQRRREQDAGSEVQRESQRPAASA